MLRRRGMGRPKRTQRLKATPQLKKRIREEMLAIYDEAHSKKKR